MLRKDFEESVLRDLEKTDSNLIYSLLNYDGKDHFLYFVKYELTKNDPFLVHGPCQLCEYSKESAKLLYDGDLSPLTEIDGKFYEFDLPQYLPFLPKEFSVIIPRFTEAEAVEYLLKDGNQSLVGISKY